MPVSNSDINASFQKITLAVRIDGGEVGRVVGVTVSEGLSQVNAQATISFTERPGNAAVRKKVEIYAGYNGNTDLIFSGELSGRDWRYFPGEVALDARDLFARLRLNWGGEDREYTSQDDAAIIQNLVEAMGIPSSLTHIESSAWTLGVVESVIAPSGRAFQPLIAEIDDLAGMKTFTRAGVIYRQAVGSNIGIGAAWTYEEGVNIINIERRETDEIVNRCVVTGLEYEGLLVGGPGVAEAQADNPYVPDPPRYVSEDKQSNLVEDDAKALEIAVRTVRDKNRLPTIYEIEAIFNPKIKPRSVIRVISSKVETGSASLIVDRVQHTIRAASARTHITTLPGTVDATAQNIPPLAAFDVKLFREGEDTGAGVTALVVGVADGSSSSDPDGDTLTYEWALSVDAGSVTPTSGTAAIIRFVIDGAATELTISLTVTDAGGAEATVERVIPLSASNMLTEPLYTAEDGLIAASADGEQTWSEFTVSGDAYTTPIAPAWGTIWGAGDGHIWASIDKLATPAVDLGAPHGAVACTAVWVHEVDQTRLWAAFDDGAVVSGVMDPIGVAATWTAVGTIPDGPVIEIRESVGSIGDLRATAGQGYYHSGDGGSSWELLHTFDTAWRMAAGFGLNLASGLNDAAPLFAEEGSAPTVPGGVEHMRGLTFGWQTQALYATDEAANLYTTDDTFASLTAHADTLPAQGNQMIRSGNVNGVIYIACGDGTGVNNGAVKWLPDTKAPWYIRKTTARRVNMIGYGPAAPPFAPVAVLLIPYGGSGATDKVWRYAPGVGWTGIDPPQAGWYWQGIVANPYNREQWLLWGSSSTNFVEWFVVSGRIVELSGETPLYLTSDGGATWAPIDLMIGGSKDAANGRLTVAWSDTSPDSWAATIAETETGKENAALYRGSSASTEESPMLLGPEFGTGVEVYGLAPGLAGDWIVSFSYIFPSDRVHEIMYVTATQFSPPAFGQQVVQGPGAALDRKLDSRLMVLLGGGLAADDMLVLADYRNVGTGGTYTHENLEGVGFAQSFALDAVFVGFRGNGVAQVVDPHGDTGDPQVSVVPGTEGIAVGAVRAGRQTRTAVAVVKGNSTAPASPLELFIRSNGVWSTLAGPAATTNDKVVNYVEVLDQVEEA
jgi:hypothetical protein